jgi:hypothetical protein
VPIFRIEVQKLLWNLQSRFQGAELTSMKRVFRAITIALFATLTVSAQQRPLITEDVDTTPEGSFRVSAGVDFLQRARFPLSGIDGDLTKVGNIQVSVGFSPNVEFQIEGTLRDFVAINSTRRSSIPLNVTGNSTSDSGDFTLSTKIKLRNETRTIPALGFKLGIQLPNSDQARGIGTNQTNVFGNVLLQKKFGQRKGRDPMANIFGNIGLGIYAAPLEPFKQNDLVLYGLAGIFRFNDRINIVSEVNGRANTRSGGIPLSTESQSQFRLGTQIKASGLRFDTAAIIGLNKNTPRSGITFNVTYQSPRIFSPAK